MTSSPARLALVHGPHAFSARLAAILARPDLQARPTSSADDLALALGSGASALVVDWGSLAEAVDALEHRSSGRPLLVACGCPDAAAVESALAQRAFLAAREDASPDEIRSLVDAAISVLELGRDRDVALLDLARTKALLLKDDLTAAYNRRFFDRFVGEQVEHARATGGALGLIFMDIDNLKAVNLKHGHAMGSLVLREAAARLMKAVGPDDRVMRYGGDEFCIVLPGRRSPAAVEVAESIRRALAERPFATEATGGVTLTASFGVACCPDHATDTSGLIRAADAAMLARKDQKDGIQLAVIP